MIDINAFLLKDYYKAIHGDLLPDHMTKSVSYFVPRKSRIKQWDHVVNFGIQAFCKEWLIDYFNKNFFNKDEETAVKEYADVMEYTFGENVCDYNKVRALHRLGYLPVEIFSLPEGAKVPIGCPIFGITNTHPDFAWLGQALESLISAEMWYPMVCATVGNTYRKIVDKYYSETCDDNAPRRKALGNFDFRGDQGVDAALKAASAWSLSFVNSATVPAAKYLEKNYNCDCKEEEVVFGAISTEHFVMCSNSAFDTNKYKEYEYEDIDPYRERIFLKKLLTEYYPNNSFSCVCDSYDYWNVVNNILPTLKDEIMNHNGCFLVRGDSGDCVKVVTETVFKLWAIFGGTVNSKGYKVLDPHVKALYGDSITPIRAEKIYQILKENGFAASNVALGVGSFSMHCLETIDEDEKTVLNPYTRDTFNMAAKCIYGEFVDKNGNITKMPISKNPKTDYEEGGSSMKKSHKGCCRVTKNKNGEYEWVDGLSFEDAMNNTEFRVVFRDSSMILEENLSQIRNRLNDGVF